MRKLIGGPAHDVRVRALEKVELRRVVGLTVFGQVEAELPVLGALVGEKAVERVQEHRRYEGMAAALPTADHPFSGILNAAPKVVFSRTLRG